MSYILFSGRWNLITLLLLTGPFCLGPADATAQRRGGLIGGHSEGNDEDAGQFCKSDAFSHQPNFGRSNHRLNR